MPERLQANIIYISSQAKLQDEVRLPGIHTHIEGAFMNMAIAVESNKHPDNRSAYKVWYLELNSKGDVIGLGVLTKEELIENLFTHYKKYGKSNWRSFKKDADCSSQIEVFDFIAQGMFENTHFGNLPTLAEFQQTLNHLQMNLELRAIA